MTRPLPVKIGPTEGGVGHASLLGDPSAILSFLDMERSCFLFLNWPMPS